MHKSASLAILASLAIASGGCKKSGTAADTAPTVAYTDAGAIPGATTSAPPPVATATPGDYEMSTPDGKVIGKTTINADGTYRDTPRKGLAEAGIVKMTGGKTCFDPSGKKPPECWTDGAPGADGSFTSTSDKGEVVTVKPIAAK